MKVFLFQMETFDMSLKVASLEKEKNKKILKIFL
jgi:hypothetical protein